MCVWVSCESAPGVPKVSYFTVFNAPGVPKKGENIYCCGSPHPKKNDFRSRYVCVFVHVLIAKTAIGKSMCVFVWIRVCLCAIRVCVCVQSVCVCLWPIFHCRLRGLLGMPKNCYRGHFRRVFTLEMTCSIRVCVFVGHSVRILMGKTQIAPHATFEFCSFVRILLILDVFLRLKWLAGTPGQKKSDTHTHTHLSVKVVSRVFLRGKWPPTTSEKVFLMASVTIDSELQFHWNAPGSKTGHF